MPATVLGISLPAITHVDHSARIQTVTEVRKRRYARLLRAWKSATGCPVLVNTSFNVRGEPIVCTPQDAYRCFMACNIALLVLENCVLIKDEQPAQPQAIRRSHLDNFTLG